MSQAKYICDRIFQSIDLARYSTRSTAERRGHRTPDFLALSYRNLDRNWELMPFLSGAKIRQPSLFVAGEFDPVVTIYQQAFDSLEETMPGLTKKVLVPGAGHWIQQERPNEVNDLLIEFLASL